MQHASAHLPRLLSPLRRTAGRGGGARPAAALLTAALLACAGSAGADVTAQGRKTVDCYCTDKTGARVELGETRCLSVDGRQFLAQCQMSLNVPMWREVRDSCLSASLALPQTVNAPQVLAPL
ncbi:hypothetical protein [Cribrihabitans neustonicus]|uniref:hypothetical protein n=1 Tax=Cribrihabitans neustonicus TaxID=1429085 RepID=UPI003B5BBDB8